MFSDGTYDKLNNNNNISIIIGNKSLKLGVKKYNKYKFSD